jgi:carbon monoxide dehydrogenase subunit G
MKVTIEKSFPMPGSADAAWAVLGNLERVAACMPGATIAERIDERHYKGTVAVRFGPANLTFRGDVEVLARDDSARSLTLAGKGTDTSGGSGAAMELAARIEPGDASSCALAGRSEVSMSGKAAAFGARLAMPVAEQVLKQFAANFAAQVEQEQARRAPASASADGAPLIDTSPAAAAATAAPLNGVALMWSIVKGWFRGLFGSRV